MGSERPEVLLKRGLDALVQALGRPDALRFLQTFKNDVLLHALDSKDGPQATDSTEGQPQHHALGGIPTQPDVATESLIGPIQDTQLYLFDRDISPWDGQKPEPISSNDEKRRESILASVANSVLGTVEQKVAYILQYFPEARDSDTALAIRYWTKFDANHLEELKPDALDILYELQNIGTITRMRRNLQNELQLFRGTPRTEDNRDALQQMFHQLIAAQRQSDPEIRFYLDETGNDPRDRFTGLGGICVINWQQYEKHHAALTKWREDYSPVTTIHFADILDDKTSQIAVKMLSELKRRRGGLLFVGHNTLSRGAVGSYLASLFVQLIVDSVRQLLQQNCLQEQRGITVIKEADEGFDQVYLSELQIALDQKLADEFGEIVYLRGVFPMPKGRDVFLEYADLIASSMRRRAKYGSRELKDKVAEAVMNVTGFEDLQDVGAVYRGFYDRCT